MYNNNSNDYYYLLVILSRQYIYAPMFKLSVNTNYDYEKVKGVSAMNITKDIKYVGVNDHDIDLFEGQYVVENGMAYNSYVIIDEKIAVMDTVDARFRHEWLDNLADALDGRKPDYLIVQHMEPDHSANVMSFVAAYPEVKVVASAKAFAMMGQFFGDDLSERQIVISEGSTLELGKHTLNFSCPHGSLAGGYGYL